MCGVAVAVCGRGWLLPSLLAALLVCFCCVESVGRFCPGASPGWLVVVLLLPVGVVAVLLVRGCCVGSVGRFCPAVFLAWLCLLLPDVPLLRLLLPLPRVVALVCLPAVVPPRVPLAWLAPVRCCAFGVRVLAFAGPPLLFRGVVVACPVAVSGCLRALQEKSQRQQEAESHGCCQRKGTLDLASRSECCGSHGLALRRLFTDCYYLPAAPTTAATPGLSSASVFFCFFCVVCFLRVYVCCVVLLQLLAVVCHVCVECGAWGLVLFGVNSECLAVSRSSRERRVPG